MMWGVPVTKNGRPEIGKSVDQIVPTSQLVANDAELSAELEWLRFKEQTLGPAACAEAPASKLIRKIKENPFVPVGAMATLGALSYGLWCIQKGRGRDSQTMMRARIIAQGFTIVALMTGVVLEGTKGFEKGLQSSKWFPSSRLLCLLTVIKPLSYLNQNKMLQNIILYLSNNNTKAVRLQSCCN